MLPDRPGGAVKREATKPAPGPLCGRPCAQESQSAALFFHGVDALKRRDERARGKLLLLLKDGFGAPVLSSKTLELQFGPLAPMLRRGDVVRLAREDAPCRRMMVRRVRRGWDGLRTYYLEDLPAPRQGGAPRSTRRS